MDGRRGRGFERCSCIKEKLYFGWWLVAPRYSLAPLARKPYVSALSREIVPEISCRVDVQKEAGFANSAACTKISLAENRYIVDNVYGFPRKQIKSVLKFWLILLTVSDPGTLSKIL